MTNNIRIKPYKENPRYWQYKGNPILLIGGTREDNLFQIPDLKEHLNLLTSVGGNYVRNTMSSRDKGDVWPFNNISEAKYNLYQWNEEYWSRFQKFLRLTYKRDIIVQIEVWATFDFSGSQYGHFRCWDDNPFNPKNNVNYTAEESKLKKVINSKPRANENNFFRSIPELRDIKTVLNYQQRFVDKLLSYSLDYPHIIYCIDNETHTEPEWGWYWAGYLKNKAEEKGVNIETTEMYWEVDFAKRKKIAPVLDHPEIYSFFETSQNNFQKGQKHWDNGQMILNSLDPVRPMNNVKMYGRTNNEYDWTGSDRDAIERFWRNIFGGMASCRFHRPVCGLGLNEVVQANLKSMKMLTEEINIFECEPDNKLFHGRKENKAYAAANICNECAVFLPDGGRVDLNFEKMPDEVDLKWLNIMESRWKVEERVKAKDILSLTAPGKGFWALVIK